MNENKNQRLAREITDFCKERLNSRSAKSNSPKSFLQTVLASFLALAFVGGGAGIDRKGWWMAE